MGQLQSSRTSKAPSPSIDALITSLIDEHPVVVFSKTTCPYCAAAKSAIAKAGRSARGFSGPHVVELDRLADGGAIQAALARRTGRRTVPNVFVGGVTIGGGDDTALLQRRDRLAPLISAAVDAQSSKSSAATKAKAVKGAVAAAGAGAAAAAAGTAAAATGSAARAPAETVVSAMDSEAAPEAVAASVASVTGTEQTVASEPETTMSIEPETATAISSEAPTEATGTIASESATERTSATEALVDGSSKTPAERVEALVAAHPVVVFSKTWCPYCAKAKRAIASSGESVPGFVGPCVVELDEERDGAEMQNALAMLTGRTTVPNVFIAGKTVGGGDDVAALANVGALEGLLREAVGGESPSTAGIAEKAPEQTQDELVAELVQKHPVLVFSKTWCPYCRAAKAAIAESGEKVKDFAGAHVVELDTRADGDELQAALVRLTGRKTVPNVFLGGVAVGGGDDVTALKMQGVLPQMLRAAPVRLAGGEDAEVEAAEKEVSEGEEGVEIVVLGAGCFWGVELAMQRIPGVVRTEAGYSNGRFTPVTYDAVCTGRTGHAEVVRVWYKPAEVKLVDVLRVWEGRHDVTSLNKQGNDRGTQYRSALYYESEAQRDVALAWKREAEERIGGKVVTEIDEVKGYNAAETVHQKFLEKRGQSAKKGSTAHIRCYG